eukprot:474944-Prymnesium_polylepis.1
MHKRPRAGLGEDAILQKLLAREDARASGDFARADRIRDDLSSQGVKVNDSARMWSTEDGRSGVRPNAGGAVAHTHTIPPPAMPPPLVMMPPPPVALPPQPLNQP